jgi:hypothetical protein
MAVLSTVLHNFGNAHGRGIYYEFDEFKAAVMKHVEAYKNIGFYMGVTNSGQSKECKWLHDIGFNSAKVGSLTHHWASYHELAKDATAVEAKRLEREAAHKAALDARPRNAAGRLLRADGFIVRRPYEYFVGDRVRFRDTWNGDWKEGTVRTVTGTGTATVLTLRTRGIRVAEYPTDNLELITRAQ